MIKILIVEDSILRRDALAAIINKRKDMKVTCAAGNADEALGLLRRKKPVPDLVLINAGDGDGADALALAEEVRRDIPDVKVVIMAMEPDAAFIDAARNAEVHSFVRKDSDSRHLLYVIRLTMNGRGVYPSPARGAGRIGITPAGAPIVNNIFSSEERAVIRLVCQGKGYSEIAFAMDLSEDSVTNIVACIMYKAGFKSVKKFLVQAIARGFVVPES